MVEFRILTSGKHIVAGIEVGEQIGGFGLCRLMIHNFNITGGSKQTTYSADVTYRKEDGVIMNTYSEDIRMRFDVSHWMLNDMLKVNLNMVKKWHKNSATNATATDQSNIYRQAIMRNPTAPIYNEDGSYNEDFNVNYYYNPVGMLEEKSRTQQTESLLLR